MKRLTAALLIASAALAACGGEAAPIQPNPSASSSLERFALRTAPQPPQACMDALATGRLVVTPLSGLGIQSGAEPPMPVVWPFGYSAVVVDSAVVLIDENGQPVARTGDFVQVGGGFGNDSWFACAPVTAGDQR